MNQQWIEAFVAVSQTQNVSQAARNLFLTQPTVTSRIQSLEQELGENLFLRADRKMQLSQAGIAFLPYAQQLLETWQQGKATVRHLQNKLAGEITIALFYSAIPFFTPCLVAFTKAYPDIRLSIKSRHSEEVGDLVLNRAAHLGIARTLSHPSLQSRKLLTDHYVLAAAPEHAASSDVVASIQTNQTPFLVNYSSQFDKEAFQRFLQKRGMQGQPLIEADNLEVIKHYLLSHMGIGFMPHFYIAEELRSGKLVQLESIPRETIPARDIEAIWMKQHDQPVIMDCLFAHMDGYIAERQGSIR